MAIHSVSIDEFITLAATLPILDVRSPGEYTHAHIPGAYSLPLFTDEERKVIGTTYKQASREEAIKYGLDYFGPKMRPMVEEVERICKQYKAVGRRQSADSRGQATVGRGQLAEDREQNAANKILVHCWRGGMRSGAVAWLLGFYGFEVYLLEGGYKAFRNWAISHWHSSLPFRIIGGYTGSGKTGIIEALAKMGEPVLDLEGIAQHKGSAFGGLDVATRPTQEMFENLLAIELYSLPQRFPGKPIYIEDESQRIGDINIPIDLYNYWRTQQFVFVDIPFEERLDHIVAGYGKYSTEQLLNAIVRIKKRLGPLETKTAIAHLIEGDIKECFRILLHYYDKNYTKALQSKGTPDTINRIEALTIDPISNATAIKNFFS